MEVSKLGKYILATNKQKKILKKKIQLFLCISWETKNECDWTFLLSNRK